MVTTDVAQLSQECGAWIASLRSRRDEFTLLKKQLQDILSHPVSKENLPDVEHYDNQFEIQLTNINHLKHSIKEHDRIASWEQSTRDGNVTDATWAAHEDLYDRVQHMEHTMDELKDEFSKFLEKMS